MCRISLLGIAAITLFALSTGAATIYVPDDYGTIQIAINASANGDTIIVRPGTYVEHDIDFKGKAISVRSELGAEVTTIDANQAGSVVRFQRGEGLDSVLEGFTLTNGTGSINPGGEQSGGGIYCESSSPTIRSNVITGNTAFDSGGGIYCDYTSSPIITNTILWDNDAPSGPEIEGSQPTVTYSDVKGGWPGTGNIDADPLFADAAGGDYHITWSSTCLDSGDNSVVTESFDFEGDPRIALGFVVDMGADEYWFHLYHSGSVIPGSTIDLKVVGWPTAPVTLALADRSVDPPTPTPHGDLHLPWPPLWSGYIGNVPSSGILTLPVTIPPGSTSGDTYYLQALVGQWGGPLTRLTNLGLLTAE